MNSIFLSGQSSFLVLHANISNFPWLEGIRIFVYILILCIPIKTWGKTRKIYLVIRWSFLEFLLQQVNSFPAILFYSIRFTISYAYTPHAYVWDAYAPFAYSLIMRTRSAAVHTSTTASWFVWCNTVGLN